MTRRVIALTMVGLALAMGVQAGERGAPAEAKAMLEKAVAYYKAVGRKQALADFNARKAPFSDRDLYVFCIGPGRLMVANGGYPSFVGQSVDVLKDANGKALGKSLIDAAAPAGVGFVQYPHINPVSHKPESKVSFVQKVGDDVCGVGAYKG
jgi:cytochrome c